MKEAKIDELHALLFPISQGVIYSDVARNR